MWPGCRRRPAQWPRVRPPSCDGARTRARIPRKERTAWIVSWHGSTRIDWSRWEGPAKSGIRIVLILVLAWVAIAVLQRTVRAIRIRIAARLGGVESARRAETLGRVIRYLVALVIGAVAFMLILAEVGISLAPILGAAGVFGVAVGFGAQSLVKDYFAGFFLLLEDQIRTGDVIEVVGITGLVEDLTLRHVRLRDYDGEVHFVPNGLVTTVTNKGRGFAYAVMDVGVAYREDVDACLAVMADVAATMKADAPFDALILDAVRGRRRRTMGRQRRRAARALPRRAARAVERAPRVPAPPEARVRRARHRDPVPARHAVPRRGPRRQGAAVADRARRRLRGAAPATGARRVTCETPALRRMRRAAHDAHGRRRTDGAIVVELPVERGASVRAGRSSRSSRR